MFEGVCFRIIAAEQYIMTMYLLLFAFLFLQSSSGKIIFNKNTTVVCTEHEIHTDCINPCQPTCQIPYPRECEFLICKEGCICKEGFIKDQFMGACIPETICPEYCLKNQEFRECGSACPPTCQRLNPECNDQCTTGCYCKEGFTFDAFYEQCMKTCDPY